MATNKPRVNVVLDKNEYEILKQVSKEENSSISSFARDLIKEALELREDIALTKFAGEREKTLGKLKMLSHKEVWK